MDGTFELLNAALRERLRSRLGRNPLPSADHAGSTLQVSPALSKRTNIFAPLGSFPKLLPPEPTVSKWDHEL